MKRIAHVRLTRPAAKNHRVSLLCLIELMTDEQSPPGYNISIRQGSADGAQRESALLLAPSHNLAQVRARGLAFVQAKLQQGWLSTEVSNWEELLPAVTARPQHAPSTDKQPESPSTSVVPIAIENLLSRFAPDRWKLLSPERKSRSVWRMAEVQGMGHDQALRPIAPRLVSLLESGNDMLDYCLAYALGRLGDTGACEAMQHLSSRGRSAATRRIARQAWLALGGSLESELLAKGLGELSLIELYDRALSDAQAHRMAMERACALSLTQDNFQTWRAIYKTAEFRRDALMLAQLHARVENSRHRTVAPYTSDKERRKTSFSQRTRHYLQLRMWRSLRRLVALGHPDAISRATQLLLAIDDGQLPDAARERVSRWDDGSWQHSEKHFSPYARWLLVRHLLLATHPDVRGAPRAQRWWSTVGIDAAAPTSATPRYEAFTALWDRHPAQLLYLLTHSQAALVQQFAARALQDNAAYFSTLPDHALRELLHHAHPAAAQLGYQAVRERVLAQSDLSQKAHWLALLARSASAQAQQFVQEQTPLHLAEYAQHALLMSALLTSANTGLRALGSGMGALTAQNQSATLSTLLHLIDWLEAADASTEALNAVLSDIKTLITGTWKTHAPLVPHDRIHALMLNAELAVARLAYDWLGLTPNADTAVPPAMLKQLLQSEEPERRALGVALLGSLPDAMLREHCALLAHFALSEHASVREASRPAITRLTAQDREFGEHFAQAVGQQLFRSEASPGAHDALLGWLQTELQPFTEVWDADYCWRATQAASRGAQRLGAWQLQRWQALPWSVKQLAVWARNAQQGVRQFALDRLRALPAERWAADASEILPLFDSSFDDAREFAQRQLTQRLADTHFRPSFLVALVDHPRPWVQALGRELLGRHMDNDSALDYLHKLSQHPSHDVQLFVTQWLTQVKGNTPTETAAQLKRLQPYFIAVLSHVNRARMAKNRVLAFLQSHIAAPETAQVVADIYARQVVTASLQDKPVIIAGLRDIAAQHPHISLPFLQPAEHARKEPA